MSLIVTQKSYILSTSSFFILVISSCYCCALISNINLTCLSSLNSSLEDKDQSVYYSSVLLVNLSIFYISFTELLSAVSSSKSRS